MNYKDKLKNWKISYEFSNGLQLWYRQTETITSTLCGIIDAGSKHDGDKRGIAHFTEHLLFDGNSSMSGRALKEYVAKNGLEINAGTGKEFMVVEVDNILPERLSNAFEVLYHTMVNVDFNGENFDREKQVVISEISDADDRTMQKAMEQLCGQILSEQYRYPVLGSVETVSAITKEDVIAFHAATFKPERMVICYAGSKPVDEVLAELVAKLKWTDTDLTWSEGKDIAKKEQTVAEVYDNETMLSDAFTWQNAISRTGQKQVAVAFGYKGLEHLHEDSIPLQLAMKIFGGGSMTSRMFKRLREDKGLCYWSGTRVTQFMDVPGMIALLGTTSGEKYKTFISEMMQLIQEVKTTVPFTETELEAVKINERTSLCSLFDNFAQSESLFLHCWITENKMPLLKELEKIEAVTLQDVQTAFNKYLADEPLIVAVGNLNEETTEPQEQEIAEVEKTLMVDRPTPAGSHATSPNSRPPTYVSPPIEKEEELQTPENPEAEVRSDLEDGEEIDEFGDSEIDTMPLVESTCAGCGKPFHHIKDVAVKKCPDCKVQDIEGIVKKPVEHVSLYGKEPQKALGRPMLVTIIDEFADFSNGIALAGAKSEGKDYGSKAGSKLKPAVAPPPVPVSGKAKDESDGATSGSEKAGGKDNYKPSDKGGVSKEAAEEAANDKQNDMEAEMEQAGAEAVGGQGSAWNAEDHPRSSDSGQFVDS